MHSFIWRRSVCTCIQICNCVLGMYSETDNEFVLVRMGPVTM